MKYLPIEGPLHFYYMKFMHLQNQYIHAMVSMRSSDYFYAWQDEHFFSGCKVVNIEIFYKNNK